MGSQGDRREMQLKSRSPFALSLPVLLALALAAPAGATFVHGNFAGTNVDFINVQETTQTAGDPEPLWGSPTVIGNVMTFSPASFLASTAGPAGFDSDHSTLQMNIDAASALDTILAINITETGDASLTGGSSTAVFLTMAGTIRINSTTAGAIVPISVPWVGTFDTGDYFDAVTNPGTTGWTGTVSIDVSAILASKGIFDPATSVTLSYNNNLQVFSGGAGPQSATLQKKDVVGPAVTIEVIPEPTTVALLAVGMIALGIRSRRPRV
jgi:hypothetical protein